MLIKFKSLNLTNFKSHEDLEVKFGDLTKIFADNYQGKSSIGESVTWLLYGTDMLGSKLDPTPVTYETDETTVTLLLNVDGKDLLLGRGLKKGKAQYYVNEVPSKAGEFNEILDQLFDKDLFLSLFNPNYFFTLHWEKQRSMVLQHVTAPANKEVLKELPKPQSDKLSVLVKKHSLDQLDKIHRENKTKLDKQYIAAQSRTKTLKEQLDQQAPTVPLDSLNAENAQILKQVQELEKVTDAASDTNREFNQLQSQIMSFQDRIEMSKERWPALKNEVIEDTCRTCKRPLDTESVEAVTADKEARIDQYKAAHSILIKQRDELKARLAELEYIDVSKQMEEIRELENERIPIQQEIAKHNQFTAMQSQVDEAVQAEKTTLESLNDSIFILDAIKDFHAKEAELQAAKVQDLFENLSIKLFETVKTTGENKPTFIVQKDGKDYLKLSKSEKIKAGLELRDVLSEQSNVIFPCFVDDAESITKFKEPSGQLITATVVAGQELKIESEDAQ